MQMLRYCQMTEKDMHFTETWIFPKEPKQNRYVPIFKDGFIRPVEDLSRPRLFARRRRHQRIFGLTARNSRTRPH